MTGARAAPARALAFLQHPFDTPIGHQPDDRHERVDEAAGERREQRQADADRGTGARPSGGASVDY